MKYNLHCTSIREFYQFPPSFHLSTIAIVAHFDVTTQTIETVTRSESIGSSSVWNFSIEYFAEEDRSGRFDSRRPNYTASVESISNSPHHFNLDTLAFLVILSPPLCSLRFLVTFLSLRSIIMNQKYWPFDPYYMDYKLSKSFFLLYSPNSENP